MEKAKAPHTPIMGGGDVASWRALMGTYGDIFTSFTGKVFLES
jgi:hypothetical protein